MAKVKQGVYKIGGEVRRAQAIKYTGDNIHEIRKAFRDCRILTTEAHKPDSIRVTAYDAGCGDGLLVLPGDHVIRWVQESGEVRFDSPMWREFDDYFKEDSSLWEKRGMITIDHPWHKHPLCGKPAEMVIIDHPLHTMHQRAETSYTRNDGKPVRAMQYNGRNLNEISWKFPEFKWKRTCLGALQGEFYSTIELMTNNNNDYVYACHKEKINDNMEYHKIIKGDWVVLDDDGDFILVPERLWGVYTGAKQKEEKVRKSVVEKFADDHGIDRELCAQVMTKSAHHYYFGVDDYDVKTLCGYIQNLFNRHDTPITHSNFVKYNFLLDLWREKHGDDVMVVDDVFPLMDKTSYNNSCTSYREYFEHNVIQNIHVDAINFLRECDMGAYCNDHHKYATDFGMVEFDGDI